MISKSADHYSVYKAGKGIPEEDTRKRQEKSSLPWWEKTKQRSHHPKKREDRLAD